MRPVNRNAGSEFPIAPDEVIRTMKRAHGLDISGFDPYFLVRTLERRVQATGCGSMVDYLTGRLVQDGAEAKSFYRSLRVGYSTFFRNPLTFALLETRVLPDLVEQLRKSGRGSLRIWSAGCAAGQEAWSVAILLDELKASLDWHLAWRVFGTDLSESDLAQARDGVYSAAELGNVCLRHIDSCFTRQGDVFAVVARLRERVEFAAYDLFDTVSSCPPESIFGGFDLIFCCNVLYYYRVPQQRRIFDKLLGCLAPGGYLVVDETERRIAESVENLYEATATAPIFQAHKR